MDLKTYLSTTRGATTRICKRLGIAPAYLSQMAIGTRPIWPGIALMVEEDSRGVVTVEEIPCDVRDGQWLRVPDPGWPWHPAGRPVVDIVRRPEQVEAVTEA